MISPDILKRSATAGVLGVTVIGGVFLVAADMHRSDCVTDVSEWADPVRVSYESSHAHAQPVIRKAPPPKGAEKAEQANAEASRQAAMRARNRAAARAFDRLKRVYRERGSANEAKMQILKLRVDHAIHEASLNTRRNDMLMIDFYEVGEPTRK